MLANLSKEIAMKLKPTSAASLFATVAVLALTACAAPATLADAKMEKAAPQKK